MYIEDIHKYVPYFPIDTYEDHFPVIFVKGFYDDLLPLSIHKQDYTIMDQNTFAATQEEIVFLSFWHKCFPEEILSDDYMQDTVFDSEKIIVSFERDNVLFYINNYCHDKSLLWMRKITTTIIMTEPLGSLTSSQKIPIYKTTNIAI